MRRLWTLIAGKLRRGAAARRAQISLWHNNQLEDRTVPNVSWHGQPPIAHVQIVTIYYGSQWTTDPVLHDQAEMLNTYFQYLTNSSYMAGLTQYSVSGYPHIGNGSWYAQDFVDETVGSTVSDTFLQKLITTEVAEYRNTLRPNANTLYFVFTPPGTVVSYDGKNSTSGFMGYTSAVYDTGSDCPYLIYHYAVVAYPTAPNSTLAANGWTLNPRNPAPGGTPVNVFQQLTAVAGAEMADAITYTWSDGAGHTISDLARLHPSDGVNPYYLLNDYLIQELWSRQANGSLGATVPPVGAGTSSTTLSTLTGPTPLNPSVDAGNDPSFDWNVVPGANWYDFSLTDQTTGVEVIRKTKLDTNSFTPSSPLILGHSYKWTVRAYSNDGVMGQFSSPLTFTVQAQPAILPFNDPFAGNGLSEFWITQTGGFAITAKVATGLNTSVQNFALLSGVSVANVAESADIRNLISGRSANLFARYQDAKNYYFAGITQRGSRYLADIYRDYHGVTRRLAHVLLPVSTFDGTGTLEFEVVGTSLRLIVVDGGNPPAVIASVHDKWIAGPGTVGIRGSAGVGFGAYTASAVTLSTPSISPSFSDPFAPTPDGQLSNNWTNEIGDFASNAAGFITATKAGPPNLAVLYGVSATDVTESVDIANLLPGQTATLVARYQDSRNYYFAGITRSGNHYIANIYRVVNGHTHRLAHRLVAASAFGGTGTIEFQVVGKALTLSASDGVNPLSIVASAADKFLTGPGSVGIRGNVGVQFSKYVASA